MVVVVTMMIIVSMTEAPLEARNCGQSKNYNKNKNKNKNNNNNNNNNKIIFGTFLSICSGAQNCGQSENNNNKSQ